MSKSTIVIRIKDSGSVCTFSLTNGSISIISSGGCDPAHVCRRAGAILTGTTEEILASVEAAFNRDQCTVEDDLYRAELVETSNDEIVEEEIDYSDYTVKVSDEPSYYGSECSQDDADAISEKLCEMIERQFPGIQTDLWSDGDGSSKTTGPDEDICEEINEWMSNNWTAAL